MAASPTRTILVLHGYSQNANIFSKRLGALRKQCGKSVEMVFIDAPLELDPYDLFGSGQQATSPGSQTPTLSELGAGEASQDDPALKARGWWKADPERTTMNGIDKTLALMKDLLQTRTFDGVLGFSQGAALAGLLAALLERPHLYPSFMVDGKAPHPPFKFCVAVSGFRPRDPLVNTVFDEPYHTPTLHVIGRTDIIVTEERSKALVEVSKNARVQYHDGGHFVPGKNNWRTFLSNYLKSGPENVPDLVPNGSETPSRGPTPSL